MWGLVLPGCSFEALIIVEREVFIQHFVCTQKVVLLQFGTQRDYCMWKLVVPSILCTRSSISPVQDVGGTTYSALWCVLITKYLQQLAAIRSLSRTLISCLLIVYAERSSCWTNW